MRKFNFRKILLSLLLIVLVSFSVNLPVRAEIPFNIHTSHADDYIGHFGSGFMLTLVPLDKPQNLITDLNIKFFRTQTPYIQQDYHRVKASGAEVQFLIYADYFGANYANDVWPGDNGNWEPWEQSVRNAVNLVQSNGYDVEYEIWNEPNYDVFWKRDQQRFFETWKRAVNIIKSMDSNARIAGPSVAWYDVGFMQNFLIYARDNNVLPNTLIWHELNAYEGSMYISYRVNEMNSWMSSNGISVNRIVINEIIREPNMYDPAHLLEFFTALERNNVYAAHACWDDPQQGGINNCFNNTLTGVVTANHEPRSLWWVYKYYSQMQGNLIYLEGDGITGFATTDTNTGTTQVLIGNVGTNDIVNINYTSDWLNNIANQNRGRVQINKYSISDNSGSAVPEPQAQVWEVNHGENIRLPINNKEVLYLVFKELDSFKTQSNEVANPIENQISEESEVSEFAIEAAMSSIPKVLNIEVSEQVISYVSEPLSQTLSTTLMGHNTNRVINYIMLAILTTVSGFVISILIRFKSKLIY